MRKRVFLLLPERYEDAHPYSNFPMTDTYIRNASDDYVIMNVYEYFRSYCTRVKATEKAMDMLLGFDELWSYEAFGLTKPMRCILNFAKQNNIPIKNLQPFSCKDSFSFAYKFAIKYHPSQELNDTYWTNIIKTFGECSKDHDPLTSCLLKAITNYYDEIFSGNLPPVPSEDRFNMDFRSALNFAIWAIKNNEVFISEIDPAKVSKTPTPMLKALLNGFYEYYQIRQTTMELKKK